MAVQIEHSTNAEAGFLHPLNNKFIEIDPKLKDYERLRLLSPADAIPSEYERLFFKVIFPDQLQSEDFNPESTKPSAETTLNEAMIRVRTALRQSYGFFPADDLTQLDREQSVTRLHVGFNDKDISSLTYLLNRLPEFQRLNSISMTDPRFRSIEELTPEDPRFTVSRGDHSKHVAYIVTQTNLRLAMNNPELYIRRVEEDMRRYSKLYRRKFPDQIPNHFKLPVSHSTVTLVRQALQENGNENISPEMEKALQYGVEYGKYFIVAAYLHDIKTPGWGDAYMKAKREKQGYSPATFSEDKELEKDIFRMVFDETSQFYRILEFHGIDKQLLATMVQSMASESDICLGGLLLKDKRKFTEEQLADPELPYAFYPKGSGYDADQMSGTETNMEWLISRFLPGGYILKKDLLDDRKPIGSFEERVRLLSFMLATGMTKDDMTEACRRIGIDPKRMFISSEEIGLGYNLALAEVELEHENKKILEIMVVATRPSDIKKAKLIFNVAQEGFYRSKTRAPVEALVQVLIERGQFGPGAQINESTFRNRTDTEVRDELNRVAPIIPWIFDTFRTNATIITAEDLQNLPETIIKNCLLLETSMADLIQFKEGTMVMTSDSYEDNFKNSRRIILPWMEVLKFKYQQLAVNEREPKITDNDLSLPKRLINAKKQLEQIKVYMLIPINVDQQIRMRQLVRSCPQTEGAMMEGFRDWKKVVDLPNKTLIPDMEVFYKDHYHT